MLACPLWAARADAKRIVIQPIRGRNGKQATEQLRRALSRQFKTISHSQFSRLARRSGAGKKGQIKAARKLGVAGILTGDVKRRAGRWVLRISVVSGHNAQSVGRASVPLRGARLDRSAIRRLSSTLSRLLRRAKAPHRRAAKPRPHTPRKPNVDSPTVATANTDNPSGTTSPSGFDDGSDVDTPPATDPIQTLPDTTRNDPPPTAATKPPPTDPPPTDSTETKENDDLGFQVTDPKDGEDPLASQPRSRAQKSSEATRSSAQKRPADADGKKTPETKSARPPWHTLFDIAVGANLLHRRFAFNDPISPQNPSSYTSPGVSFALAVDGAIYPLAPFFNGVAGNFGVVGRYWRTLGLKSQSASGGNRYDTVVQAYEFGLRYRWNILDQGWGPTFRFGADFGNQGFWIVDAGEITAGLPNITYSYLKIAPLDFSMPFYYSPTFSIGGLLTFDYLIVFSAGDIERTTTGGYGASQTGALEAGAGLFLSYRGFFARLKGYYRRYFFAFDGTCYERQLGCSYAGGALDQYFGGLILAGYSY